MQIEKNGISLQDFATIYNLILEWNRTMPSDTIELRIVPVGITDTNVTNIKKALEAQLKKDYNKEKVLVERLLEIDNPESYYFEFKSSGIGYNNDLGRINKIDMKMIKK